MLSVEEATARILAAFAPLPAETVRTPPLEFRYCAALLTEALSDPLKLRLATRAP